MKKIFYILLFLFLGIHISLINTSGISGPFLKINDIINKEFPKITIDLSIIDPDNSNTISLNENHFIIYEDGFKVNYLKVISQSNADDIFYFVFSIDSSKSINEKFLTNIKKFAIDIINNIGPRDKIAIYNFNDNVKLINNFISEKNRLINNINNLDRKGKKTLLYNSIYDSIELLKKIDGKSKTIIVFTDGKDEGSSVTKNDIIKYAKENGFPINFICFKSSKNLKKMARISKLTGGKLIYGNEYKSIPRMHKTLFTVLKNRFIIKYHSMIKPDGKNHRIEIKLKYGSTRDRVIKNFRLEKNDHLYKNFSKFSNIILLIIALLLIIILTLIVYYIKREKKILQNAIESDNTLPKINSRNDNVNKADNRIGSYNKSVIISDDPESEYTDVWLIEKNGPETGKKFPIFWDEIIIGRSNESSIIINDESVSIQHAKIKNINDRYYLFDLASENGTYLNGKKLLRPKAINDWDEIRIGRTHLIFRGSKANYHQ